MGIFVFFGCYPKKMDGRQEEIHNILVALLSGDEKEIYNVLYKKKEIDDKTPKLRTDDEKKNLKSLSNKMRKFPKDLIDGIQKKFPLLQRTPKTAEERQAAADITGQLQVRPMLYTLYIGINLTIIIKQYGESEYRAPLSAVPM